MRSFIILLLLITVGCTHTMYNKNLPDEQIAILVQNYIYDEVWWKIYSVDSEKLLWRYQHDKFKLLPGSHTLVVVNENPYNLNNKNSNDGETHRVFFKAQAGHVYELTNKILAEEFSAYSKTTVYKLVVEDITDEYKKN